MINTIFGILVILHGLVHLLYFGQSSRYFELQPGLKWPDGSWALSGLLGDDNTRKLAGVLMVISAIGFVVSGVCMFMKVSWWRSAMLVVSLFAAVAFVLLWDGVPTRLDDKGAIGILIDLAIVVAVVRLQAAAIAI